MYVRKNPEIPEDPVLSEQDLAEIKKINAEGNKNAGEARRRLGDFLNAKEVLEGFLGNGVADGMPLGEALMFLDGQKEEVEKSGSMVEPRMIEATKELFLSLIGEGLTENTPCGQALAYIDKEIDRLTDIAETEI